MNRLWKYKIDVIIFWMVTIGFHLYTRLYLIELAGWGQFLLEIIIRNSLLAIIIYTNINWLIPEYIVQQKKYAVYIIGLIGVFSFYLLSKNTHDAFLTVYANKPALPFWRYSFYNFSIALFYMAFTLALQLSKEWFFQRARLQQLEIEKLNTELKYLKSQINPHFLFNSLNTVFFQIDKSNGQARETLSKFSDMLRFQLYECSGNSISLEREVQYLKNYVDLQRLRKDEKYSIHFEATSNLSSYSIAPMMFIPLVENAFKHVSHHPYDENKVEIRLVALESEIELAVKNTKDDRLRAGLPGGIGLKNLKRRLELQYPEKHSINVIETKSAFEVTLRIKT